MGIVFAGSSSYTPTGNQDVSTTGATIPLPTGLAVGDYILAAVYLAQLTGSSPSIITPSGWTVLNTSYGSAANRVVVMYGYKITDSTALSAIGTSFQAKAGASAIRVVGNVHRLTGVDLTASVSVGALEYSSSSASSVTFNAAAAGTTKIYFLGTNNSSPSLPPVISSTGGTAIVTNRSLANAGPTADSQLTTLVGGTGATYSVAATNHVSYGLGFTPLGGVSVVRTASPTAVFATSISATITAPAVGNSLIATIEHQASGTITVTDNTGNTWTRRLGSEDGSPTPATGQFKIDIWDLINVTSGHAPTTVTVSNGTSSVLGVSIMEVSGAISFSSAAANSIATTVSGTSPQPAVTAATGDLVVTTISFYASSQSTTVASPYTLLAGSGVSTTRYDSAYLITSSAGSTSAYFTTPSSSFTVGAVSACYTLTVANIPPTASFTHAESGLTTTATSTSTDSDGTIASYDWDWGDSTAHGTGASTTHTYVAAKTYSVILTVTDNSGGTATATQSVTVLTSTPPLRKGYSFTNPGGSNTSIVLDPSVVTSGSAISDNDWMVAVITTTLTTTSVTAPTGWTTLLGLTSIGTLRYAVYGKIRVTGATTYSFTLDAGGTTSAGVLMWGSGADSTMTNWTVGANTNRSVATDNTAASITTTVDHSLVLGVSVERTTANESAITSVTGATEWFFMPQSGSQIETIDVVYVADKTPTGATTVIDWTYPNTQSTNGMGIQIAIPPPGSTRIALGYSGVLRTSGGTNYNGRMFYWDGSTAHDFSSTLTKTFTPVTVTQFLSSTYSPWFSAHRGFSYSYPEETLYGYRGATDWGIKAIEVSAQMSADGTWWCFHDPTTTRTTGVSGTISSMTDVQIAALNNLGTTANDNTGQPSRPTAKFVDVVNQYYQTHVIIVEDKTYSHTTAMLNLLDSYGTVGRPANEIFIWKVASSSSKTSFFDPAAARGYHRWAYIFDSSMSTEFPALPASGKADLIGMDYNSSDATLSSAIAVCIANGVMPTGHIINSTTQRDRLLGLGMKGLMMSSKNAVPPWYNSKY